MQKQIRNLFLIITAFFFTAFFCLLPNLQALLTDWNTFGKTEKLALNPVEISVESTQTTSEKLKIINNHMLSVSVMPSTRTDDGADLDKNARKQLNQLFHKMKISFRIDADWKVQYKKLYTHIAKKKNDTNVMNVSDVSDVQNLLIWYIALAPENQGKEEKSVNLIMDAYTNQILALDVYSDHYYKDWKELADHLEDIPNGFLSYLDLKRSERGFKKTLQENEMISEQYQKLKNANLPYTQISGSSGIYATEDGVQTYIPVEWTGYGFMINNVYNT